MKTFKLLAGLLLALSLTTAAQAYKVDFPHRAKFSDVPVIETAQLAQRLGKVNIIDVRSHFEFETLHIKGAVNIPLSSLSFAEDVQKLKANGKPVIFYCNGGTCKKSYKAVKKARKGGVNGTTAYDAGIYNWAQAHPEHSVLLGQHPMDKHHFIDNKSYKSRFIDPKSFEASIGPRAMVLDIRDRAQRDLQVFPFRESRAELHDMDSIAMYVNQAKRQNKTLLVYDKVGKQVRWFQYYLEKHGVKKYYFMKGGSEGYYEATLGKFKISAPE